MSEDHPHCLRCRGRESEETRSVQQDSHIRLTASDTSTSSTFAIVLSKKTTLLLPCRINTAQITAPLTSAFKLGYPYLSFPDGCASGHKLVIWAEYTRCH